MKKLTRVEVLDQSGQLAGLFFTAAPLADCRIRSLLDFKDVKGDWVPAGGVDYEATGSRSWFYAEVSLGEMVEVDG